MRNLGFVGNLLLSNSCEFYCDGITVASFVNDEIRCKHPVKETAFCYSFSVDKITAEMPLTLRCVQYVVTTVLEDQHYYVWCKSLLVDEKRKCC